MTIQQMNYYIETCRLGRISLAAEALHISPNGLRLALHRTEQELNCKLFEWGASGISLTKDGIYFLRQATEICEHYRKCEEHFHLTKPEPYIAKVAVGEKFPNLDVTHFLAGFNWTGGQYSCVYQDFYDAQSAVADGSKEIGFDIGPIDRKKFVTFTIAQYPIYAIVSTEGPLGDLDKLPPEKLHGAEIILNEKRSKNADFFSACHKCGIEPVVTDIVGRELTVWFGIQINPHRIGITNIESALATDLPGVKAIPIDSKAFTETVYMFRKRGNYLSPAAERLEQYVKRAVSRHELQSIRQLTNREK